MSEILIVGAGPVGLTMAAELARYGVDVRIIDRAAEATQTSKALVIWSRTLELLDRSGCVPDFLASGLKARGVAMHNGSAVLGRAPFDIIASPFNFALMIPQRDTERLLTAQLAKAGVEIERGVELLSFVEKPDHVEAMLRLADGSSQTVATPWLIGCDGAHSTVRHGLGFDFEGSAQRDDWILADVRLEGDKAPPADEISIYFHRDGPLAVFPLPGGRARVIAVAGRSDPDHPRPGPTLADVQAAADSHCGDGVRVANPVWLSYFRINERKVADYGRGRAFLAGDAAHVHSPAGGQGMNTGMQDAFNLAWKIAMVEQGRAAATLLESYSPERSAVGAIVLRNATLLTDFGTLSQPLAQAARNLAMHVLFGFHAFQDRVAETMSETGIGYPDSPLSVGRGAGTRLPPQDYGGRAPGGGHAPRFVLFAADTSRGSQLTANYPDLIEATPRSPSHGNGLMIVRPDGYIGLVAGENEWSKAEDYLDRLSTQ